MKKHPPHDQEPNDNDILDDFDETFELFQALEERATWHEPPDNPSLIECLRKLCKDDLTVMRRFGNLRNASRLKKDELSLRLAETFTSRIGETLRILDVEQYQFVTEAAKAGNGLIPRGQAIAAQVIALFIRGLLFPISSNGKAMLYMPPEIREAVFCQDSNELRPLHQRNTLCRKLVLGLLYERGLVEITELWDTVKELAGLEEEDFPHFIRWFYKNPTIACPEIRVGMGYVYHILCLNPGALLEEWELRPELAAKPVKRAQLLAISDWEHAPFTAVEKDFAKFLRQHYEVSAREANEDVKMFSLAARVAQRPGEVHEHIDELYPMPECYEPQAWMDAVNKFYNRSPQWGLKGHCPAELSDQEQQNLKRLPQIPLAAPPEQTLAPVIPMFGPGGVGRNEPCPCGSGKKYKKCCLK